MCVEEDVICIALVFGVWRFRNGYLRFLANCEEFCPFKITKQLIHTPLPDARVMGKSYCYEAGCSLTILLLRVINPNGLVVFHLASILE